LSRDEFGGFVVLEDFSSGFVGFTDSTWAINNGHISLPMDSLIDLVSTNITDVASNLQRGLNVGNPDHLSSACNKGTEFISS
jgi:hypothetical protein